MKYLVIIITTFSLFTFGCKSKEGSNANNNSSSQNSGNNVALFEGTGIKDISSKFGARQDAQWPEVAQYLHFRTNNIMHSYLQERIKDTFDFTANDVVAIIGPKIEYGVDYIVDSLITTSSPIRIQLHSVRNDKVMSPHRPSFIITLPKNMTKVSPTIKLDSILVGGIEFNPN